MYRWQLTVRATSGSNDVTERELRTVAASLLAVALGASNTGLAACIRCEGEFTLMADWSDLPSVEAFERGADYLAAIESLSPHLRVPPKRELCRRIDVPQPDGSEVAWAKEEVRSAGSGP